MCSDSSLVSDKEDPETATHPILEQSAVMSEELVAESPMSLESIALTAPHEHSGPCLICDVPTLHELSGPCLICDVRLAGARLTELEGIAEQMVCGHSPL